MGKIFETFKNLMVLICLGLGLNLFLISCAPVKPYQRGDLLRRCMESPFSKQELKSDYENKVLQTAAGGELPANAQGGGCGCTR